MGFAVICMAVGTGSSKFAVSKLGVVSALPGVSLAAVLVGAFVSKLTYFIIMFVDALLTKLTVAHLGAVRSEIMDPENRRKVESNLPKSETKALKDLINLQRNRIIQIKQCDKGSGVFILNFDDYIKSCDNHLNEEQTDENGTSKKYYKEVNTEALDTARTKIKQLLQEGLDNKIISKEEFQAMYPEGKNASKFYCNFKVHKEHQHGEIPPVRPIVSCSGGILENPSAFVEHHIN